MMPARLIGQGEELEKAYQLYLIEQKKQKLEDDQKQRQDESDSDINYHEGAIPK
jgi:hypothetical protein